MPKYGISRINCTSRVAERLGPRKTVVTIIVDSGLRYLSNDVFRAERPRVRDLNIIFMNSQVATLRRPITPRIAIRVLGLLLLAVASGQFAHLQQEEAQRWSRAGYATIGTLISVFGLAMALMTWRRAGKP